MQFKTTLVKDDKTTGMGIDIPADIVTGLNAGKRPPVVITLNGYSYRTTVFVMGGRFMVPLAAEHRTAAGVSAGETLEVTIVHDTAPRTVNVPDDFAAALDTAGVREKFDKLSFTHRKEHVRAIEEAKAAETRARRIAKSVAMIAG